METNLDFTNLSFSKWVRFGDISAHEIFLIKRLTAGQSGSLANSDRWVWLFGKLYREGFWGALGSVENAVISYKNHRPGVGARQRRPRSYLPALLLAFIRQQFQPYQKTSFYTICGWSHIVLIPIVSITALFFSLIWSGSNSSSLRMGHNLPLIPKALKLAMKLLLCPNLGKTFTILW